MNDEIILLHYAFVNDVPEQKRLRQTQAHVEQDDDNDDGQYFAVWERVPEQSFHVRAVKRLLF
ncbi:hypothetical protein D3C84_1266820 [compost metagenome]